MRRTRAWEGSGRRDAERLIQAPCLLPPSLHLRHSVPLTSQCPRMRPLGSLVLVGFTRVPLDFFFFRLSQFCVDCHLHSSYNSERDVNRTIFFNVYYFSKTRTVYTRVSCDLVYHATLKILASKHYFIIYYKYHASCIFERPDKIVLGRLGYDCRTRWLFDNYLF